jgi:hypothetical protein
MRDKRKREREREREREGKNGTKGQNDDWRRRFEADETPRKADERKIVEPSREEGRSTWLTKRLRKNAATNEGHEVDEAAA